MMAETRETLHSNPKKNSAHPAWEHDGDVLVAEKPEPARTPKSPLGLTREEFKALLSRNRKA